MKRFPLILITVFMFTLLVVFSQAEITYAANDNISFDNINVLEDLLSSTVNGKAFKLTDYPYKDNECVQILSVVEYCYSYKVNMQSNYGLYVYIYNPSGLSVNVNSAQNKVQLAVSYNSLGSPDDYEKFQLKFCSVSDGEYPNLFYKLKVIDHASGDGKTILQRVNSNERRYDISGIELLVDKKTKDIKIGGTYKFTGYAKGYGPDASAASNLNCVAEKLETVVLDVKNTFYRSMTSIKGKGYQNQLDTVYFSVPKRLFNEYGALQRIKAEWYEYKTKDIVVTSHLGCYNALQPYMGVQLSSHNADLEYGLFQSDWTTTHSYFRADWGWNANPSYYMCPTYPTLYYSFYANNGISDYDPYAKIATIGGVESNVLYKYIQEYNKTYKNGTVPTATGTVSADLFENDIDSYRKVNNEYGKIQKGYSYYDFDADVDIQKLTSWSEGDPSFWDNWKNWGFWNAMVGNIPNELSRTVSPIYIVQPDDLDGSDSVVSDRLLMHSSTVSDFRNYYKDAVTVDTSDDAEEVVVMFRFAASDYFSTALDVLISNALKQGLAYRAWESVFLNFDIIQLTFNKDGVYTVIPVVSDPIDIVNAITPPVDANDDDWIKNLLMIILLILAVLFLVPFLPSIINFTVSVISFVIKIITYPFKLIFGDKDERR